jgi:hypothetical protein
MTHTETAAGQATALELARDAVPWLVAELERLLEESETMSAQLDDCHEEMESRAGS